MCSQQLYTILTDLLFRFPYLLDESIDWREMQTLVRSMPDLHKTLVLANVKGINGDNPYVEELAITTEHAPFRHRPKSIEVGGQRKAQSKRAKLEN